MDIGSISVVLGSIKTATDIAKYIKDSDVSLEKAEVKLKLAELIGALADAKLEVVGVQQTLAESEDRIRELQKKLDVRAQVKWDDPVYWIEMATGRDGPFCQRCYDADEKLVRLQGSGDGYYSCRVCSSSYTTAEHRAREEAAMRAHLANPPTPF
jgi:RNA-splicing ligase RtcB